MDSEEEMVLVLILMAMIPFPRGRTLTEIINMHGLKYLLGL